MAVTLEIFIIIILIVLNGLFSMAEFALVSARKIRLQQMAERGEKGADTALSLSEDPNTFLSTIQVGITLVGILTGAFGGAAIANEIEGSFTVVPALDPYAGIISLFVVVLIITYFTLVFGELVPKRVGLLYPEQISAVVAGPIIIVSKIFSPINKLASLLTDAVLWVFNSHAPQDQVVTEEDITSLLEEGTQAGVFDEAEQELVQSAFRFGDREVTTLMAPRPDVVYLDLEDSFEENKTKVLASGHTRYPVCRGGLDSVIGVVSIRDLWSQMVSGEEPDLTLLLQDALVIPEHITALRLLELFRTATTPLAVIMDEYGSVAGIITLHDLLEAIVGDLSTVDEPDEEPGIIEREDGSWFIDGMLPAEELRELLGRESLPGESEGVYRTAAGFIMAELGKIPIPGDHFVMDGIRFEVADMDKRRIDKILVSRTRPRHEEVDDESAEHQII
ncbi:hemolysin family protein [uncultured Methanospirillum sp.]|uniref:hemolysin family protein n=1 Tax=uncultured Methanospirillum sp. TaxID=262503 RepID=UPI0029C88DB2|nr:hemolysin family protein [uncultured Methanospirillum sp.]